MKTSYKIGTGLLTAALAASVFAQATVAELRNVTGNVLVSTATGMTSGANNQRVTANTLITTTAQGGVSIAFDGGCVVTLKANERIEVKPATCDVLVASIQAVPVIAAIGTSSGAAGGTATGFFGGSTLTGMAVVGAAGAGGIALYNRRHNNVSPN